MPSQRGPSEPIRLTEAGRRRLEALADAYARDLAAERATAETGPEPEDFADAGERLEEADDRTLKANRLAALRDVLARARPLPEGPDDGVVRLGSTVTVRDGRGEERRMQIVDPAEVDVPEGGVAPTAADSPLGRGLLGRRIGDVVAVETPEGRRVLRILAVQPYRAGT